MSRNYLEWLGFLAKNDTRSLQDLEGQDWGNPKTAQTDLVRRCLTARRRPIRELSLDDLRRLIGQGIGREYLIPRALDALEANPLVDSGIGYPGSLLNAVLQTKDDFWLEWPELRRRVVAVLDKVKRPAEFIDEAIAQFEDEMQ